MKLPKAKKINAEKYVAGLSLFKKKSAKIKLSANESALGPSPKAIRIFYEVAKNIQRYPDSNGSNLKKIISKKFNLNHKQLILGSGSDQIFELVCKAFLNPNDEVIVSKNSFILYRIYSKLNGAKVLFAKEKNFFTSVKNILSMVTRKTKIVFLANPNNPTGTYINKKEIIKLRNKLRSDILLVIDDAYFEYVNSSDFLSGLKLFSKRKNTVVTRTFSKIYGLAGLRVGWAYASKDIIKSLEKIRPPFAINSPGLAAAASALSDIKWLRKEINHINKWRNIMFDKFKKMKIETNKGNANFLLINFDKVKISSRKVFQNLAKSGIIVRNMEAYKIKNSLRVTIGTTKENKKFILKLGKIINV
ncbi:MAG: histidinol-phosphate transaminase [Pelagibacteraceae bacterium]|jgi:histidinol-phosphate aminotransferase